MKKFKIHHPKGATPLEEEERIGLIPDYITKHEELNELEQNNIQEAHLWIATQKSIHPLEISFIYKLHKKMFENVWRWAGSSRASTKNIGIDKSLIVSALASLIKDTEYWIQNKTFSWDEIATRFHHRLVAIHIFPNGNGRHARLLTDLLLEAHKELPFSWGKKSNPTPLEVEGDRRTSYIKALKKADQGDYQDLIQFVKS